MNKEGLFVHLTDRVRMKNKLQVPGGAWACMIGWLILALIPVHLQAQSSKTLNDAPGKFIDEFESRLLPQADKATQQFLKAFRLNWETGKFTEGEQKRFIRQTNTMLQKNYAISSEVLSYAKAFGLLKSDSADAHLDVGQFFDVTDSCILTLDRVQSGKFYGFLQTYLGTGAVAKTSVSSWAMSQKDPALGFTTRINPETGGPVHFPYLQFQQTDVTYRTSRDSTHIYHTSGELNLFNKMFNAVGGRIDWAKMKLDPRDVYAELMDYGLNMNYSFVKIDTVVFHYNSLIGKPLKGCYEDMNKGYTDINKANYPYFRSYDGGVVIENFIQNVRYEGGFSLRG
ncbi:MAG: hypothetical protein RLZZ165_1190, partial [Bacteroidota bacterium]